MSDAPQDELDQEDDELSLSLGRLERDAALVEPRPEEWEALARGELSLQDALASRASDADVERAAAYFRPFDEAEQGDLVDGLLASLTSAQPSEQPNNVVPLAAPAKPKPHDPATSSFWWIPGGMLAAAAAAIAIWWVWPPSLEVQQLDDPQLAVREPLPNYVLETDGGLKQLRGETGADELGRHRYRRDTAFEWVLRPKLDFADAIGVRGFAFVDGGSAGLPIKLEPLATVAKSGAIRISGKIAELNLEPGRYTIVLAVGRPAQLPADASEVAERGEQASDATATATWLSRRIEIVIED